MAALLIGFAAGLFCYFMVATVKRKFGYDDSLDAFGVHGAGGTLGALLTGVFATNAVNNALKDTAGNPTPLGLVDGNAGQILNQGIGMAIAWVPWDRRHTGDPQSLRHYHRLACRHRTGKPGSRSLHAR